MGMSKMPDHTQKKLHDQTVAFIDYCMQKANFLPQSVFEIFRFKKLYNLIVPDHLTQELDCA